jgi:NADPH:quinone reductase-like Zn-dependent oxidoreductase
MPCVYLVIDYTKTDPKSVIPAQSVDFLLDTVGDAMQYLSLMRPKASSIVSIASLPSGDTLQKSGVPVPFYIKFVLNLVDAYQKWRASRWGVSYLFWFLEPNGEDLDLIRGWVEEGELKPIVGTRVHYKDMAAVREACTVVYKAKGGIGKTVISFE